MGQHSTISKRRCITCFHDSGWNSGWNNSELVPMSPFSCFPQGTVYFESINVLNGTKILRIPSVKLSRILRTYKVSLDFGRFCVYALLPFVLPKLPRSVGVIDCTDGSINLYTETFAGVAVLLKSLTQLLLIVLSSNQKFVKITSHSRQTQQPPEISL